MLARIKKRFRQHLARKLQVPEIPVALERLRAQGLSPRHIFDVGAYSGDFARECVRVWPRAAVTCFEPLPDMAARLRALHGIHVSETLLGSKNAASVPLHVGETASSVLDEHHVHAPTIQRPQTTVDAAAAADPPDFLKLDVQGYELEVLKGSEATLPHIDVILAEMNLLDIHRGVPLLAEVVGWLDQRNFVAFDIAGLTRRPLDGALWQADLIFIKRDSPLRSDKRWMVVA